MKKRYVGISLIALLTVVLVIVPNSPLNKLMLHRVKNAAEENWKSRIKQLKPSRYASDYYWKDHNQN